jgi:hypothetical protein
VTRKRKLAALLKRCMHRCVERTEEHYAMPKFKIIVMIVWLSNADGSIVAHASGIAVDVPACERLAAQEIAEESGNPDLENSTPKFSCWNTSKNHPRQQKPAPGSAEL